MYSSYLFCQQLRWSVGVHVDQKSSLTNSVSRLVNRVQWLTLIPSHYRSLSHSLTLLSISVSLTLTFLLHLRRRRHTQSLIPSRSVTVAVVVTPSPPRSVFLPQWLAPTTSQKVRTLFFLDLLACINRFFFSLLQMPYLCDLWWGICNYV